jgi:uncharacterized protein DUF3618
MDQDIGASSVAEEGSAPLRVIEDDIARTRVRLSATIEALERELAPRRVLENGAQVLRDSLEPRPCPFRDQVWAYAIPASADRDRSWLALRTAAAELPAGPTFRLWRVAG